MSSVDCLFWFRRDLRTEDNTGLYQALKKFIAVQPIFIFDTQILNKLDDKRDKRLSVIHDFCADIQEELQEQNSSLKVYYGDPVSLFEETILKDFPSLKAVYTNTDYEPYATKRDKRVEDILAKRDIHFVLHKDHVLLEKNEVLKQDGDPYVVYTPYFNTWKEELEKQGVLKQKFPFKEVANKLAKSNFNLPDLSDVGFEYVKVNLPEAKLSDEMLAEYPEKRDYPAIRGTSKLSVYLRFGKVSIRNVARKAAKAEDDTFLSELAWRDFYQAIL
ncbi:MAG: deoxyribodipyrimidine photo-lyase, partial [Luteibaculum sp.]